MHTNESIPVKQLNLHKEDSETRFLETILGLRKWLIVGAYKLPYQSKSVYLEKPFNIFRHIRKRNIIRRF